MQITLRLCDSLHAKVREKARELGRSVNSYLVQLIQSDLQLPESRVPPEIASAKKTAIQADAERLLNWSLEHQGEEPTDQTMMEEFSWSERMILPRRSLFKALYRRDPRIKELKETLRRKAFDFLDEMKDENWRSIEIKDHGHFDLDAILSISKSYAEAILKDLEARGWIEISESSIDETITIQVNGFRCANRECSGIITMRMKERELSPCHKCGQIILTSKDRGWLEYNGFDLKDIAGPSVPSGPGV